MGRLYLYVFIVNGEVISVFIYWRLIAQSTPQGSPEGFSLNEILHKLKTIENMHILQPINAEVLTVVVVVLVVVVVEYG